MSSFLDSHPVLINFVSESNHFLSVLESAKLVVLEYLELQPYVAYLLFFR